MGIALSYAQHSVDVTYGWRTACTHRIDVPSYGEEGDEDGHACQSDSLGVVHLDRKDAHS